MVNKSNGNPNEWVPLVASESKVTYVQVNHCLSQACTKQVWLQESHASEAYKDTLKLSLLKCEMLKCEMRVYREDIDIESK